MIVLFDTLKVTTLHELKKRNLVKDKN